ncbi:UbiA family prenyltransferase [Legionella genomosp. 1]|uniref:UbiA family prenyltransferase n=1 Tax=Legionella genomosp. 1 TaxID=1093625 RepID=UPI001055109C|nr:UbiA family prenyltransferase [Legionella genomosp. 1]
MREKSNMNAYLSIARIDNWPKNLLMFAGAALAAIFSQFSAPVHWLQCISVFFALCLASSANYVLNEYLDRNTDKFHPVKKDRALAKTQTKKTLIIFEYCILFLLALGLSASAHANILIILSIYMILAWLYNIPPVRLKDVAYIDVLLESVNYPLRVMIGWLCILPHYLPPSSLILTTWAIGAFTMSMKRVAEYRIFQNRDSAIAYRKSYALYTTNTLILSAFIYGLLTIFGITILMLKYKAELIILMPFLIGWMGWYFLMGLEHNFDIIYPEKLIFNKIFIVLLILLILLCLLLLNINIPSFLILVKPMHYAS